MLKTATTHSDNSDEEQLEPDWCFLEPSRKLQYLLLEHINKELRCTLESLE